MVNSLTSQFNVVTLIQRLRYAYQDSKTFTLWSAVDCANNSTQIRPEIVQNIATHEQVHFDTHVHTHADI